MIPLVETALRRGFDPGPRLHLRTAVTPKLLEFLREIVPKARVLAVLFNPLNPTNPVSLENLRVRADSVGVAVLPIALKPRDDPDALFAALAAQRPDALQIIGDPGIGDLRDRIAALAQMHGSHCFRPAC
jgi:putative tryptophan/tyrosine transport system substrate-binding protein